MSHRHLGVSPKAEYGVLVGTVIDGVFNPDGSSPHYEISVAPGGDRYRVAVNVRSTDESEVLVHYDPAYVVPAAAASKLDLAALASAPGFTARTTGVGGTGLDYVRGGLFDLRKMTALPATGSGVSLQNLLDGQIERAKADAGALAIVFGDRFEDAREDPTFHNTPDVGVHNIHMTQGDSGTFAAENRSDGDGALFIRYSSGETIALFTRFMTQSITTDENGEPVAAT